MGVSKQTTEYWLSEEDADGDLTYLWQGDKKTALAMFAEPMRPGAVRLVVEKVVRYMNEDEGVTRAVYTVLAERSA